uniref:Non-LTR retroelement reverse transcriptase n=1 Tax=Solanum tuberosum TaxID=4113 RepID=M1BYX0_SOLTU
MEALAHFSATTGLEANLEKSSVFLAGVDEDTRKKILIRIGFSVGQFPIRYLGLPLSPKKWKKTECFSMIDKITLRITITYSKQLSYADRLQIINVVLFSIQSFWGAMFILPQSILKEIDKICRVFLWGCSEDKKKRALISWERVCFPKRKEGLNIKGSSNWNIASVGQLLWKIVVNKESLWLKWVHGIYIKTYASIWNHKVPTDCSWYRKKLNALKIKMQDWYNQGRYILTQSGTYSITRSYLALMGHIPKLRIAELVWTSMSLSRHRFLVWLVVQGRLLKGRLLTHKRKLKLKIPVEDIACCLCDEQVMEATKHLFEECR